MPNSWKKGFGSWNKGDLRPRRFKGINSKLLAHKGGGKWDKRYPRRIYCSPYNTYWYPEEVGTTVEFITDRPGVRVDWYGEPRSYKHKRRGGRFQKRMKTLKVRKRRSLHKEAERIHSNHTIQKDEKKQLYKTHAKEKLRLTRRRNVLLKKLDDDEHALRDKHSREKVSLNILPE
jgi:hypothetical protein